MILPTFALPVALALSLAVALSLSMPGESRAAAIPPQAGSDMSLGLADALMDLRAGRWGDALDAGARSGPVGRDVIDWLRLREGGGDFEIAHDFLARNADWPGLALLRRRTERHLPVRVGNEDEARKIAAFFGGTEPATARGVVSLVDAYRRLGLEGDASAQAALAWITRSLTDEGERRLWDGYRDVLAPLEAERLEEMFWAGSDAALARAIARADGDAAALGRARRTARARGVTDALLDELPPPLHDDAGLAHIRFTNYLDQKRVSSAVALLRERSVSAEALGRPAAWARDRRALARQLMRDGDHESAYAIAASHWLTPGSDFADLEWLSGYLALRFLEQPDTALAHFKRFRAAVVTPISLGRAGYWLGRAHEALGDADAAAEAYALGAEYQTSFYGLLAAEKLGRPLDPALTGREVYPPLSDASFAGSSVLEAALLLQAAGERDLAEQFLTHLSEGLGEIELGTLGDLLLSVGEPHLALMIAKAAAEKGITLPRAYYPVVELGVDNLPVEPALALTIARRESEFDPGVASGVGARGLMQLMPGTASDVARSLRLPYSSSRLFSDPSYNATLGSAYLAGLIERFGNNPLLVSAGYNAGPGRPLRWIEEVGDPRRAEVDAIDWIEHIPFDETRNYVMRVAESLPVYRARITGETGWPAFTEELKGR